MGFHYSAQNIYVEEGHMLHAELENTEGEFVEAEIDLNDCLGNNDGAFEWGGGGFRASAEDVSFDMEGDDANPILRANLYNVDGELVEADVNLAERLQNNDGSFAFDNHQEEEEEEEQEEEEQNDDED